jgi:hypothetical protein
MGGVPVESFLGDVSESEPWIIRIDPAFAPIIREFTVPL